MKTKLYTLEEANKTLPEVEKLLDKLSTIKLEISKHQAEIDVLELLQEAKAGHPLPSSSGYFEKKLEAMQDLFDAFKQELGKFTGFGCELKDLDLGLVDFYSLRGDQLVYLCWKKGEKEISHWHELDAGFKGRRPL